MAQANDRSVNAYCYRCGFKGWAPGPQLSLAERLAANQHMAAADLAHAKVELPMPQVHDLREWPPEAVLWLLKAGLGAPEIARLGAYYHPDTDRVVLPVLEAGVPVFWQARAVLKGRIKYLSPPTGRDKLVPRYGSGAEVVLTEDLLSAFKVGQVGEAWSLMGTNANPVLIGALLKRGTRVAIWLDPDPAGIRAAQVVLKKLKAYGLQVRRIRSARDPKLHTFEEIKEYLCE